MGDDIAMPYGTSQKFIDHDLRSIFDDVLQPFMITDE